MTLKELASIINSIDIDKYGDCKVMGGDYCELPVKNAGISFNPENNKNEFSLEV